MRHPESGLHPLTADDWSWLADHGADTAAIIYAAVSVPAHDERRRAPAGVGGYVFDHLWTVTVVVNAVVLGVVALLAGLGRLLS